MKIEDNIGDKYSIIIDFLKAREIEKTDQLHNFDCDELYFVPGITDQLIDDFKKEIETITSEKVESKDAEEVILAENEANDSMKQINEETDENIILNYLEQKYKDTEDKENFITFYKNLKKELMIFEEKYNLQEPKSKTIESIFKDFPKGNQFIEYCDKHNYKNIDDLKDIDIEDLNIRGIGISSLKKISDKVFEEMNYVLKNKSIDEIIGEIHKDNYFIKLKNLKIKGLNKDFLERYNLENSDVIDLKKIEISENDYSILYSITKTLKDSVLDHFSNKYKNSVKEKQKRIFLLRAEGNTLETIGNLENVTRERIRQICKRVCEILEDDAIIVLDSIIKNEEIGITLEEVLDSINDKELTSVLVEVIKSTDHYVYVKFINKFVRKNIYNELFEKINDKVISLTTNGMCYEDLIDELEDVWKIQKFFTENDLKLYLHSIGCKISGNIIYRGRIPYGKIVSDIINKYYKFDIKLDDDEQNDDMFKLRQILEDKYGLIYDSSNRAFTSVVVRDCENIVLSGRGRYCSKDKIDCDINIIEEIIKYINQSNQTTFYYSDLFEIFKNRLVNFSSIDNYNFLHGILMYFYPDDYDYSRDYLTKKGVSVNTIDQQLINLIETKGTCISYEEILQSFPSLNKIRIAFIVDRNSELINWSTNQYNSINNIGCIDINELKIIIDDLINKNNGYLSAALLYKEMLDSRSEFLNKNKIDNPKPLFYIIQNILSKNYDMSYPHIVRKDEFNGRLSTLDIIMKQVKDNGVINWDAVVKYSEKMGWVGSTMYAGLNELNSNFVRLSKDNYIEEKQLIINEKDLNRIEQLVEDNLNITGFYSLDSIHDFENYPEIEFEWNTFLLESVITKYLNKYRVVAPTIKDRRYQRNIIVKKSLGIKNFEELIVYVMKKDGRERYTESELYNLLSRNDLVSGLFPQEIYSSDMISYKNELFKLV